MHAMNPEAAILQAYESWASTYAPVAHNPLMRVEQAVMCRHWPDVAGARALDLACGTGRYSRLLAERGAGTVVALDYSPAMLRRVAAATPVRASMMQLPFAPGAFDTVICGLALGHANALQAWMSEVARVLAPGGTLLYSDFHPDAARAGLTRSFRDEHDRTVTLPHQCFGLSEQRRALAAAQLEIEVVHEVRVGQELRESVPGSDEFYARWHGLALVVVVRARRWQR
jgi:ubiquinone/menaquinone biosynthesis C-methylase UbiE